MEKIELPESDEKLLEECDMDTFRSRSAHSKYTTVCEGETAFSTR